MLIGTLLVALAPIAILISLGTSLRLSGFLHDAFWSGAERLCYFILLPALFLHGMATARLDGVPTWALAGSLLVPTVGIAAAVIALRRYFATDDAGFTSIFQGAIRFNNYAALTAAIGILGPPAIAIAAVATAVIVTTVNILCAVVFSRYGTGGQGLSGIVRGVASNPLVSACVLGGVLQASGLTLPPALDASLKALGQASLPVGLICVGAGLNLGPLRPNLVPVVASSAIKLIVMPLATWMVCLAFHLESPAALIAVLFQAMPTASSSYVMARHLGGDAQLMACIVALETFLAALTVPLVLLAFGTLH